MRVNQLLRRQIVKTVIELRGRKTELCRCIGQTQAFQAEQAPTMAPLELLVAGPGKTWLSVNGEARSSRSTRSQHCPPLEPELGESHGDFSVSPNLLQPLTGLHIVLVSVYSGLAAPWPAESWM